jgi:hypothetical protein
MLTFFLLVTFVLKTNISIVIFNYAIPGFIRLFIRAADHQCH